MKYMASKSWEIGVEGISVECSIGILPHEITAQQPIEVNVYAKTNITIPELGDIRDTFDYRKIREIVISTATACHHDLMETLAEKILERILQHRGVVNVTIELRKPRAFSDSRCAFVSLSAENVAPTAV